MLPITVKHLPSGLYVAEHAFWANTALNRAWGWLGKDKALPGEGLLLKPCSSIHTLGMRFSMDLLFLDRGDHVVKLMRSLSPFRAAVSRAYSVLELPAGALFQIPVKTGDPLEILARKI
jgi:uncharacterized membrane protein (UPF0127 family)